MTHRTGATLMEVLVAIFVTAIGLLAMLALFPLGALTMARAISDDRTGHIAANAGAMAGSQMFDVRKNPNVQTAFVNPGGGLPKLTTLQGYNKSCYPVYVDPIGVAAYSAIPNAQSWVAADKGHVPRVRLGNASATDLLRWFTSLDDISFGSDGTPKPPALKRDNRYSWAYLCRKPYVGGELVDLTIVVYNGRTLQLSSVGVLQPLDETDYTAYFTAGGNVITMKWNAGQQRPNIRKGSWILDTTIYPATEAGASPTPDPKGYFYRVVNITEGANQMDLEIQGRIKGWDNANFNKGTAAVMERVAEVFERASF